MVKVVRSQAICQYCGDVYLDTQGRITREGEARAAEAHQAVCSRFAAAKRSAQAQRATGIDWLASGDGWH